MVSLVEFSSHLNVFFISFCSSCSSCSSCVFLLLLFFFIFSFCLITLSLLPFMITMSLSLFITHMFVLTQPDRMSSTVVKKRIDTYLGAADYTGDVNSKGAPHGRGSYEVVEGKYKGSTYDGTFINGEIDGFGKYTWSDGQVWSGEWKEDLLNGFGRVCVVFVCPILNVLEDLE